MDERSERLRRRRKRSSERADGTSEEANPAESAEDAESADGTGPEPVVVETEGADADGESPSDGEATPEEEGSPTDRSIPVKEEQTGTYMYLPETQVKHLRRQYNVLKAEYEFEYGEEFEKNRHFYPLVVRYGVERLDEMDTGEIRARLEELYE